jgi:hypothetical protein
MATFRPFIGVTIKTGSTEDIYLHFFGWNKVGQAQFTVVEDYRLSFKGEASVLGNVLKFSAELTLTDQNTTSTKGSAEIAIDGKTQINGSYSVDGSKLTITASSPNNQTVIIERGGSNWPETYTHLLLTGKQHNEAQLRPPESVKATA